MTGEVIAGTSRLVQQLEAGGLSWTYREVLPEEPSDNLPVLCLHGLGSSGHSYRNTLRLLGQAGHRAVAPDWIGHGGSSKPTSGFDYSSPAYCTALAQFVEALQLPRPYAVVVQGYVLGQYGLQYALQHADDVAKLVILNTPLNLKSKLRPELAAYKAPLAFMRPKPDATFDAANFNAGGSPYAMAFRDAEVYAAPYGSDPAASAAVYKTMEQIDFGAVLREVDEGYATWRKPSLVLHGSADPFVDLKSVLEWLESKRTCMRLATGVEAKLGCMPQEDYAEAIHPVIAQFLAEDSS